jgi:2-polyprenyl-3-methyl-5-hydroxy-6-metoxy-1,4-benzoquinol methylase/spore coat polysaccharide biosynthesis predicted glycosyltransferase SpsG
MTGGVLVVPACGSGRGGGHLVRSVALVRELRSLGRDARLFISSEDFRGREKELFPFISDLYPRCVLNGEEGLRRPWDWIVLDKFRTSRKEFEFWASLGPLIGIDEGGPLRDRFDFLLDILPGLPDRSPANRGLPALIPLPKTRREKPESFNPPPSPLKALVTFGAEDPAGLTLPVCRALAPTDPEAGSPVLVTAIPGSLEGNSPAGPDAVPQVPGVRFIEAVPDLKEKLASYDLVITHFGLTAFEALHAGTPVLLLSPTAYHEKLARHAGLVSAGIRQNGVRRIRRYVYRPRQNGKPAGNLKETLNRPELEAIASFSLAAAEKYGLDAASSLTLGGLIAGFRSRVSTVCPVCGEEPRMNHPVLARFPERTYRRCPGCGMVSMLRLSAPPIEYAKDYFSGFYRRQYGKTYLEDFPNLKQTGKIRLHRIRRLLSLRRSSLRPLSSIEKNGTKPPRLLDIGCAYGPFLVAALEGGFAPLGIDPAEDAVRYVRDKLKIPAIAGFFPNPSCRELRGDGVFDAVTLWYVIEHFEDADAAIREISRLLKSGGVLAFSTPSISGVSGRKSLKSFLEKSPGDHVTVWNPRRLNRALNRYGFTVKKTVITGHHPERFPLIGRRLGEKRGTAYRIVDGISRLLGLGDTFEAYAVKK